MKTKFLSLGLAFLMTIALGACSSNTGNRGIDQDHVKKELNNAGLKDVQVSVDNQKKEIRLNGTVKNNEEKQQAATIAKGATQAYVVANGIRVQQDQK